MESHRSRTFLPCGGIVVILPRQIEPVLFESIEAVPVVILERRRAAGKSTLWDHLIVKQGSPPPVDLSNRATRDTYRIDPTRFLSAQPIPCVIDEAQLEPDIAVHIKHIVDKRGEPG